ncbi:DUF4249 domain-containing protein [Aquimarina mytili]|uniref:DUF4249 domain-containing protein n=1 Tax=Aquimarina mytili TaxID=874423 RepID=A0A936ZMS3_9FLAO|nr:DUF4249 family protein [Aquimarina mytili]MBL0682499.1 DUF4249 domain-containing protein [Aquimarina mytili]
MKKIFYILISITICLSCEDVVDVDVLFSDPRLVVDASFELYTNETPVNLEGGVRLTLSAPYFDTNVPTVSNANVFITNKNDDSIINFVESGEDGFYIPETLGFLPEFNTPYELTVNYLGETYVATTQLIPTVPIDNVVQGDATLFDDDETEIIISFTDDGSRDDFYLFDFDFSLFLASEDRFYQGQPFKFSYFYENMVAGQDVTIKILGVDQRYYNYATLLIEQSEQDGGNPFLAPPSVLRGNIINTTNQDNFAYGYFNLSEADRIDFTIEDKNL